MRENTTLQRRNVLQIAAAFGAMSVFSPLGVIRPPHIHFIVSGHRDKLVTQMYFEGEPLNQRDPFLLSAPAASRELLVAKQLPPPPDLAHDVEPDSRLVVFDIVTLQG